MPTPCAAPGRASRAATPSRAAAGPRARVRGFPAKGCPGRDGGGSGGCRSGGCGGRARGGVLLPGGAAGLADQAEGVHPPSLLPGAASSRATTPTWARQARSPGEPLCPAQPCACTVFSDWSQPSRLCHHSPTRPLTRARTQEASPSPVYGAALLMRFGSYRPSRVQIPPPPPSHHPGAPAATPAGAPPVSRAPTPSKRPISAGHPTSPQSISPPAPPHVMLSTQRRPALPAAKPRTRSSTDRASDYGSEGCRFESCRVHTAQRPPEIIRGPLAWGVQQRSTATPLLSQCPWPLTTGSGRPVPPLRSPPRRPPSSWRSASAGGCAARPSGGP